jgi:hypothetical protein
MIDFVKILFEPTYFDDVESLEEVEIVSKFDMI